VERAALSVVGKLVSLEMVRSTNFFSIAIIVSFEMRVYLYQFWL
jgi:hypothetical protein